MNYLTSKIAKDFPPKNIKLALLYVHIFLTESTKKNSRWTLMKSKVTKNKGKHGLLSDLHSSEVYALF